MEPPGAPLRLRPESNCPSYPILWASLAICSSSVSACPQVQVPMYLSGSLLTLDNTAASEQLKNLGNSQ